MKVKAQNNPSNMFEQKSRHQFPRLPSNTLGEESNGQVRMEGHWVGEPLGGSQAWKGVLASCQAFQDVHRLGRSSLHRKFLLEEDLPLPRGVWPWRFGLESTIGWNHTENWIILSGQSVSDTIHFLEIMTFIKWLDIPKVGNPLVGNISRAHKSSGTKCVSEIPNPRIEQCLEIANRLVGKQCSEW